MELVNLRARTSSGKTEQEFQEHEVKLRFTHRADKDYAELPAPVRKAFGKQF